MIFPLLEQSTQTRTRKTKHITHRVMFSHTTYKYSALSTELSSLCRNCSFLCIIFIYITIIVIAGRGRNGYLVHRFYYQLGFHIVMVSCIGSHYLAKISLPMQEFMFMMYNDYSRLVPNFTILM